MNDDFEVLDKGTIYIEKEKIVDVKPSNETPPQGFEEIQVIRTGGTIYPGLIELHNHLCYNILPLWNVPKTFKNRGQWQGHRDKTRLIRGPMYVLGRSIKYIEAIIRYVECKCLISGVTTSQGITLADAVAGTKTRFKGLVRNVEATDNEDLPNAGTRIADVAAREAETFLDQLEESKGCKLLHLSEGVDERSRAHFFALQISEEKWAITDALSGIHCVALEAEDFDILKKYEASIVWSPLSNYLLYGQTARIRCAKDSGLLIALGSDWSPTGSKNLLCELKIAHLINNELDEPFTKKELVSMVTRNAAKILKWDKHIGTIEKGKIADLVVINGQKGPPYQGLIDARETSITFVVIDGIPRYGQKRLMDNFKLNTEILKIKNSFRLLNLETKNNNPISLTLKLSEAVDRLQDGLSRLGELATDLEQPDSGWNRATSGLTMKPYWFLSLEQDELATEFIRPHIPYEGNETGFPSFYEAVDYPTLLKDVVVELDPLAVVDDKQYFKKIANQVNLPDFLRKRLPSIYGVKPILPESITFKDEYQEELFDTTSELSTFLSSEGYLKCSERLDIVNQALVLLEQVYVHLPHKKAMYAIDPIQRLKLLQYKLERTTIEELPCEIEFHKEMIDIFKSTRDLHTNYLLPHPFKGKIAFMPFIIEECFIKDNSGEKNPKYIVSYKMEGFGPKTFKKGVEITHWNGIPIKRAIELNSEKQGGGNPAARRARGINALTIRPLINSFPPDEEWVTFNYRSNEKEFQLIQKWLVFAPPTAFITTTPKSNVGEATALGLDLHSFAIQEVKKLMIAPDAVKLERNIAQKNIDRAPVRGGEIPTDMPSVFRAKKAKTDAGDFAYIRIFTFKVDDSEKFVKEFIQLLSSLPKKGLIIDIRDNGGGLIMAAERLLQTLTPNTINPEKVQFLNTRLMLEICEKNSPSNLWDDFDLKPWKDSIHQAIETGATYSRGFPITSLTSCNNIGQKYYGPVVLITNGLTYSAADMFAAGFKDHNIGTIIGVNKNTGAGGANVWSHDLLLLLMKDSGKTSPNSSSSQFFSLPKGANMTVAARRMLRVGKNSTIPLEDFGVTPDVFYQMTDDDLLNGNKDLINKAGEILSSKLVHEISFEFKKIVNYSIIGVVTTENLSRLDFFIENRPIESVDVQNESKEIKIKMPKETHSKGILTLEIRGYEKNELKARLLTKIRDY